MNRRFDSNSALAKELIQVLIEDIFGIDYYDVVYGAMIEQAGEAKRVQVTK